MKKLFFIFMILIISIFFAFACANNEITDNPNEIEEGGNPAEPDVPAEPNDPDEPDAPAEPDDPNETDKPGEPNEPNIPEEPDKPDEPTIPEEPHTHVWGEGEVTKQVTCKEFGLKTYVCSCGEIKTEEVKTLLSHKWDLGNVTVDATCKDDGIKSFTCLGCGENRTEAIPKTSTHLWDDGELNGITKVFSCKVCNSAISEKTENINILIVGAGTLTATSRDSDVLLARLLERDAKIKNVRVDSISIGAAVTRIDSLFSWSKTTSGTVKLNGVSSDESMKNSYNKIKDALAAGASVKYDYVIIVSANAWNLVDGQSYGQRELLSFLHFEEMISNHNPAATLIIGTSAPLERYVINSTVELYSNGKLYYIADNEHGAYKKIYQQAKKIEEALNNSSIQLKVMLSDSSRSWLNIWESGESVCDMYNDGYTWPAGTSDTTWPDDNKFYYHPFEATAYALAGTWFCDISGIDPSVITVTQWQKEGGKLRDVTDDVEVCDFNVIKAALSK